MVYERFYGLGGSFLRWRCVSCGEIIDEVILENSQTGMGRQSGGQGGESLIPNLGLRMSEDTIQILSRKGYLKKCV